MIEHLLDQESHSQTWRSFDFHMQTSVIPDESYLSTFALNSPMKSQTHHVGLYWLKRFSGQTKYNLCKHLAQGCYPQKWQELYHYATEATEATCTHGQLSMPTWCGAKTKNAS